MKQLVKFTSALSFTILATACSPANNITSPGGGYTHDTSTDIVVGAGYEWLRWDVTAGMSIEEALNIYTNSGWNIASSQQMARLFNDFQYDYFFDTSPEVQNVDISMNDPEEDDSIYRFISMFGDTKVATPECNDILEPVKVSAAKFDVNPNGGYRAANAVSYSYEVGGTVIYTSYFNISASQSPSSEMSDYHACDRGVALVRAIPNTVNAID